MGFNARDYDLNRYEERRNKGLKLLGGVCVKCGTTENLQFDHIDPATKLFNIWRAFCLQSGLHEEDILPMRELRKEGQSYAVIGSKFGVSAATARNAIIGKTWVHVV